MSPNKKKEPVIILFVINSDRANFIGVRVMTTKKDNPQSSIFIEIVVLTFWIIGFSVVYMLSMGIS